MRFNIFRNPFVDSQVTFLLDTYDQALRNQTEEYWRDKIINEILQRIEKMPKEDGGYCHVLHYCDVVEEILLCRGKRYEG